MQWLQAAAAIFYTNFHGTSLEEAFGGPELERATWLSLVAVLFFAVGMRLALQRTRSQYHGILADGMRVNIGKAFLCYLAAFAVASVAGAFAFSVPRLTQIIFAFLTIKWVAVFILAYAVIEQRSGYIFLGLAILLEFAVGLLGYFAGFKSVFFLLLVVIMVSPLALRGKRLISISLIAGLLFSVGVVWTAIKGDYREFLNQGREEQVVLVSVGQQIQKIQELLENFTWQNLNSGLEDLMLRLSYVHYFALTLITVPDSIPHENGALWLGALKHVVTPRLFFPDKAAISDSERTSFYTGTEVSGVEQGTSIGIGYVGESYIDFGPVFMFVPVFLFGLFCGLIYRVFVVRARYKLLGAAIATSILIFGAYTIETSNIKLVGGNLMAVLVLGTLYLGFGGRLNGWLTGK